MKTKTQVKILFTIISAFLLGICYWIGITYFSCLGWIVLAIPALLGADLIKKIIEL